jgi:hypothetical protein
MGARPVSSLAGDGAGDMTDWPANGRSTTWCVRLNQTEWTSITTDVTAPVTAPPTSATSAIRRAFRVVFSLVVRLVRELLEFLNLPITITSELESESCIPASIAT